jgi:hypothetical protein
MLSAACTRIMSSVAQTMARFTGDELETRCRAMTAETDSER